MQKEKVQQVSMDKGSQESMTRLGPWASKGKTDVRRLHVSEKCGDLA